MAHKSYIVLRKDPSDPGLLEVQSHPYRSRTSAHNVAKDLSIRNPGSVFYVATIETKVRTEPSEPIFEYFS
jgi:hypothetical protein